MFQSWKKKVGGNEMLNTPKQLLQCSVNRSSSKVLLSLQGGHKALDIFFLFSILNKNTIANNSFGKLTNHHFFHILAMHVVILLNRCQEIYRAFLQIRFLHFIRILSAFAILGCIPIQ